MAYNCVILLVFCLWAYLPNALNTVVFGEQQFYTYYYLHAFVNLNLLSSQTKELSFHPLLKTGDCFIPWIILPFFVFFHNSTTFFLRCEDETAQGNEDVGTALFSVSAELRPLFSVSFLTCPTFCHVFLAAAVHVYEQFHRAVSGEYRIQINYNSWF